MCDAIVRTFGKNCCTLNVLFLLHGRNVYSCVISINTGMSVKLIAEVSFSVISQSYVYRFSHWANKTATSVGWTFSI